MNFQRKKVLLYGTIGSIGALLTIIADIAYNMCNGNHLGGTLYITFLALFSFPLWWGGIWVIYQGLKPAGAIWSLVPCLIFAFYTSTINVFYHSCYPFWASIREGQAVATGEQLILVNKMVENIREYTSVMNTVDTIMQIVICSWIAIAILARETYFSKWIVLIIPICPTLLAMLINQFYYGFFNIVEPYLACVPIFILFIITTRIISKRCIS